MKIVSSYPRSGSAWFRFIICNLYYPAQEHSFITVNHLFPSIDTDRDAANNPVWVKTHHMTGVDVVIYRHVGDVLISQWWYNKKHDPDWSISLDEYIEVTDYGQGWRDHANYYKKHPCKIAYDDLINIGIIDIVTERRFSFRVIAEAITKSDFEKVQKIEEKGFGVYPTGDKSIKYMRRGTSDQWFVLGDDIQLKLLEKNEKELKRLNL